jgi:hypothetical protein
VKKNVSDYIFVAFVIAVLVAAIVYAIIEWSGWSIAGGVFLDIYVGMIYGYEKGYITI